MRRLAGAVVALGWLVVAATAGAADHDGRYTGVITCDVLPGQTIQALKTEFSMTVANGQAAYEREVLRPNNTQRLGITERGTGTVSPSGEVALTGSARGPTWSYEADYRGRFDGKDLRLSGTQQWRLPSQVAHSRPCTVTLSR
ncbi:MAG TPA: hypothetical protein VF578_08845 [Methylomirabilota bacterium]